MTNARARRANAGSPWTNSPGRAERLVSISMVVCAACGGGVEPGPDFFLTPYAASTVPLSENPGVALVNDTTVCTIESYENRVYCTSVNGAVNVHFGRAGEGPGEFQGFLDLARGPDGAVGVIDAGLRRMSIFDPAGTLVSEVQLPNLVFIAPGSSVFSSVLTVNLFSAGVTPGYRQVEIDVESGEIVWERTFPGRFSADAGCTRQQLEVEGLGAGAFSSQGSVVFPICEGRLLFFAGRDDSLGTMIEAPRYVLELPSEREVEEYLESAGTFADENFFRNMPKPYPRLPLVWDDRDRLWVVTNRGRTEGVSHLDVYSSDGEYRGAVGVRHDALAINLRGSTLAVLVDRPVGPEDVDGYPDRGVDWYDIGWLEFSEPARNRDVPNPVAPR